MNPLHEIFPIVAVLCGALVVATGIGLWLRHRVCDVKSRTAIQNLNARITAWWAIVVLAGTACIIGRNALIVLFAIVSFCVLREIATVIPSRRADRGALLASSLLILPLQYLLIWAGWSGIFAIFIPVYAFLGLPILAAFSGDTQDFLARSAETHWGLMIAVYSISYVPALLTLHVPGFEGREILLIVFLLIVVQSSDVLQYVFGKLFGKHQIAPCLSPSKTVEGLIGGVAGSTLLGIAIRHITPFTVAQAALMSLVIAGAGFLGGLVMSAIKRDRKIKDWGHLIGGHGGMLDRVDSVCFSAPIFFYLTRYLSLSRL